MSGPITAQYTIPDPNYLDLLKTLPSGDYPFGDVEAGRQAMHRMVPLLNKQLEHELPDASTYTVTDHSVAVADGSATTLIRTVTPTSSDQSQTFPVLYYIHGGGFTVGTIEMFDYRLRAISVELQIAVALIEYRLAPEHLHPVPVNDCYDGLKWIVNNAASVRADILKGFIVAGESVGANLAAAVAHRARDDPFFQGRPLTGQVMHIPSLIDPRAYPEKYKAELRSIGSLEHSSISGLPSRAIRSMFEDDLQNSPEDPSASPLLYLSHTNLPPAVIQIAGLDHLRDEGFLYEKLLRESGVKTKLTVYAGWPHGFHVLYPSLPATKGFIQDYKTGLGWLLNGAKD